MSQPIALQTYPANLDTGIPIGIRLEIIWDRGIDLSTGQHAVVLYGDDFDQTSGPDQALWIDKDTGNNPFFLRSPGFKGLVELDATVEYVDLDTGPSYTTVDPGVITGEADEVAYGTAGVGHKLILTPRESLAPDTSYTLHVLGPSHGVSSRTVFDVEPDIGNASTTGIVLAHGGYDGGNGADTIVVEITTAGDIGTAKYRWYYDALGVGTAKTGVLTNRRFRRLDHGLQLRFSGSGFAVGDIYRFNVEPPELMAANFIVTFTTNDGTYVAAPTSPSTPATSSPPASVLPPAPGSSSTTASVFEVVEMDPPNGSFYNSLDTRTITITFSDDIDPATVTNGTVRVFKYPVSGIYGGQPPVVELSKVLTVVDNILTIEI